ncbi:MAG: hypothetical protein HYW25_03195 [Candidatus Aenigmarchaeota archaeon]|nr:hypothetical protein [Candidatus Aenigmarchaeota archaeon]
MARKIAEAHDLMEVANSIGIELEKWPRKCHIVSYAVVRKGLMRGRAAFGHYYGPVSPTSALYVPGIPAYRHGWIVRNDSAVADFTRWVFEDVDPYLFISRYTHEYDEGGSRMRRLVRTPPPLYDPDDRQLNLHLSPRTMQFVLDGLLGGSPGITFQQGVWLANLDLSALSGHAGKIYGALKERGMKDFVPTDSWRAVMTKNGY